MKASEAGKVEVVLRPGCYLTHDVGIYRKAQTDILARNPVAKKMGEGLLPALQLWAYVQSIPEPDRAIIGLGKRDSAFDAGMPEPARHYRPGNEAPRDIAASEGWEIFGLMDQHAYLRIPAGADLKVGDMIAFDISHPCLTFDKWRRAGGRSVVSGHGSDRDVLLILTRTARFTATWRAARLSPTA